MMAFLAWIHRGAARTHNFMGKHVKLIITSDAKFVKNQEKSDKYVVEKE